MATSGSFQSNSESISGGYYGELQFTWTSSKTTTPGMTKVEWQLTGVGRENLSSSQLWTTASVLINNSVVWSVSNEGVTYNSSYASSDLDNGSFNVNHNSNGSGTFSVVIKMSKKYNTFSSEQTYSYTGTLDTNYPYTKCGAPTSVTASGIVTPNGTFTVSWSGASAGTSNSITGYRVYYTISSSGTAPTTSTTTYKDITSSSTSGSTTISLSNATRNYKVVCGVVTKGSAGSSYYSSIKTGGSVTINSLPAAPAVSVDKTTIPSTTGAKATFTITAGSDVNTSQTKTLYYSTSSSGTKTKITSPWSVYTGGTYYFWTSDGLEFSSSYTSKTITKNTAPTISASYAPTNYSANGNTYTNKLKVTYTLIKNSGTLYTYIKVGSTIVNTVTTTVSSTSFSIDLDINKLLASNYKNTEITYSIESVFNDNIENSTSITSSNYKIAAAPTITKWSNDNGDSTNSSTTNFYFGSNLRLYYNLDSEANLSSVKASGGAITGYTSGSDTNGSYVDISFSNPSSTTAQDVTITLEFSNGTFIKTSSITLKQIATPTFGTSSLSKNTINCFQPDNTTLTFTCKWPFEDETGANYGFNGLTSNNTKLVLIYGGNSKKINVSISSDSGTGSAALSVTAAESNFCIFDKNWTERYVGNYEVKVQLETTNNYGLTFYSSPVSLNLNYNHAPEITSVILGYGGDEASFNQLGNSKLQEGLELWFKIICNLYTEEDVDFNCLIDRSGSSVESSREYTSFTSGRKVYSTSNYYGTGANSPGTNTFYFSAGALKEITNSNQRVFKCSLSGVTSGLSNTANTVTAEVLQHTAPSGFVLTNVSPTENDKTQGSISFTINDFGYDTGSYSLTLNGVSVTNISGNKTYTANYSEVEISNSYKLSITTTVSGLVTNSKTYDSNTYLFFSEAPTVSYRKNLVALNHPDIDSQQNIATSVLVINQASGKNYITLLGASTDGGETMAQIDLSTGALSGFIINGGIW